MWLVWEEEWTQKRIGLLTFRQDLSSTCSSKLQGILLGWCCDVFPFGFNRKERGGPAKTNGPSVLLMRTHSCFFSKTIKTFQSFKTKKNIFESSIESQEFLLQMSSAAVVSAIVVSVLMKEWFLKTYLLLRTLEFTSLWTGCKMIVQMLLKVTCVSRIWTSITWPWWFGFRHEPISGNDRPTSKNVAHI